MYDNILKAFSAEAWAIVPEKLEQIAAVIAARCVAGEPFDWSEVPDRTQASQVIDLDAQNGNAEADGPVILDGMQVIELRDTLAPRMNMMMKFSGGTSTQLFAKEVNEAAANPKVTTIILAVDSPGGAVKGTEEARQAVFRAAQEKRVVTLATNNFNSAAYYIGSAASEVIATPSTSTPSVGVFGVVQEISEAAAKAGVKFRVFRAGELKAAGNQYEPLTDARAASIQSVIDSAYRMFLESVAENRNVSVAFVERNFGQGSTMSAAEALELKIIDRVALIDDVVGEERDRARGSAATTVSITAAAEGVTMFSPKVKAQLFANGLIDSIDASDETCQLVVDTFFAARGEDKPTDNANILRMLQANVGDKQPTAEQPNPIEPPAEPAVDPDKIAADERQRITEIRARAESLGLEAADYQPLIDSGASVEDATVAIFEKATAKQVPVTIVPGESQADKLTDGATAVMAQRCGLELTQEETRLVSQHSGSLGNFKLLDLCRKEMQSRGLRISHDDESDAADYLMLGGPAKQSFGNGIEMSAMATANSRGEHPGITSNLANKALNAGYPQANTTYQGWSRQIPDLTDFKPRSFYDVGIFNQLDLVQEREAYKELKFTSEMMAYIKADRYGNYTTLTVEMLIDDNIGGFLQQLSTLTETGLNTLNRLHIQMLTQNPLMVDNTRMFDVSRNNLVSPGAQPDADSASTHRYRHRIVRGFGSETVQNRPPTMWLGPASWEKEAKQAFLTNTYDPKTAQVDDNINTVRNELTPVIDANLDEYNNEEWYTMVGLRIPAFIYAYGPGGRTGVRRTWIENSDGNRRYSYEVRFGAAPYSWRGIVKNEGTTPSVVTAMAQQASAPKTTQPAGKSPTQQSPPGKK